MQRITKVIHTETGHRLTNYKGRCAHIHGHSYKWEVTVEGENTDNGMVMDFKELKEILKDTIDTLDHAFVMHNQDPIYAQLGLEGLTVLFTSTDRKQPRLHIVPFNPTVENLVDWQMGLIMGMLPIGITLARIKCWETANSYCEQLGE